MRLAPLAVRLVRVAVLGAVRVVVLTWELLRLAVELVALALSAGRGLRSLTKGGVRCPRGHVVPLAGERYTCTRCSYTYEGSALICPNPECQAVTPHLDCPVCSLSVHNPYRWGRP